MEIADRRVATVHFTLRDEHGAQITSTHGHAPLVYMHGTGSLMPGLEQALSGKSAGDTFRVTIAPTAGFGPRHEPLVQVLPRSRLQASAEPVVGARLAAQTAKGPLDVVVVAVDADTVTVDGNHPLAGRTVEAQVEVVDVRLATPHEQQFGLG
ncbi:MAG TPA: FKBP-type peptidyl-prolyl cis-trans isomerase [Luteimonas sp.]|nr:FKBP-type peptidyl-prolyl cis-trans isomerase [Luteimonas sp.]